MTDIVKRLRDAENYDAEITRYEAADEIARLRSLIAAWAYTWYTIDDVKYLQMHDTSLDLLDATIVFAGDVTQCKSVDEARAVANR